MTIVRKADKPAKVLSGEAPVDDALACIERLNGRSKRWRRREAEAKYWMARVITVYQKAYGDKFVQQVAARIGQARTYIYDWLTIAELTPDEARRVLGGDGTLTKLKAAASEKQRALDKYVEDPRTVIERLKDHIERMAVRLAEHVERFLKLVQVHTDELSQDEVLEAEGVAVKAWEELEDTKRSVTNRVRFFRSKRFLAFVRRMPCCICGTTEAVEAHHTQVGGEGTKGSDLSCVPLCRRHHNEVESMPGFWARHERDLTAIKSRVRELFIEEELE